MKSNVLSCWEIFTALMLHNQYVKVYIKSLNVVYIADGADMMYLYTAHANKAKLLP